MFTASRQVWNWREETQAERRVRLRASLRRRGLIGGAVALIIGTALNLGLGHVAFGRVLVVVGAVQAVVALRNPLLLARPLAWLGRFGRAIGTLLAWVLLTPLWLLVFVPGGLWRRLRRRDPLRRAPLAAGLTAWVPRRRGSDAASARRQFQDEDHTAHALERPEGTLPAPELLADLDRGGGPA